MPIHDWTRVPAGIFHDFHSSWITHLKEAVAGILPPDYYVLAEQVLGEMGPDVLTLQGPSENGNGDQFQENQHLARWFVLSPARRRAFASTFARRLIPMPRSEGTW